MKIDDYLQHFTRLHPKSIDLSLDRIWRLLHRLGDPQRTLPPVIHVAGTNGKGSVVAYLRAMLEGAGKRVHCYTSPHLVRFNERIRLSGRLIDDAALERLFEECDRVNAGAPITFFEMTTVAAFLAFARHPADYAILEVGLGGRLDTTNTSETTVLSVVTSISLDHQRFLGNTLDAIAREKAGIFRPDVPAVAASQPDEVAAALVDESGRRGARLMREGRDWSWRRDGGAAHVHAAGRTASFTAPSLPGAHQWENAAVAAAAALVLGDDGVPPGAIARGIASAAWPARLQRLDEGPLRALLPPGAELWLDGGHNPSAAQALAAWLDERSGDGRPAFLVVGMMQARDPRDFLACFRGRAVHVAAVAVPGEEKSHDADELAAAAASVGLESSPCEDLRIAFERIARTGAAPRVLICGSLYLAGEVLRRNGPAIL